MHVLSLVTFDMLPGEAKQQRLALCSAVPKCHRTYYSQLQTLWDFSITVRRTLEIRMRLSPQSSSIDTSLCGTFGNSTALCSCIPIANCCPSTAYSREFADASPCVIFCDSPSHGQDYHETLSFVLLFP